MATGIGNLPFPGKVYNPFDILTAEEMNEDVANIESLADGSGIGDGSVKNINLATGSGEPGGPWTSWTPTLTNLTIGNGSVVGRYRKIGQAIEATIAITIGSTSSFSGTSQVFFSLPVTAQSRYSVPYALGASYIEDAGVAGYTGIVKNTSTTAASISGSNSAGTYAVDSFVRSNVPFSFGNGDFMTATFEYEAA